MENSEIQSLAASLQGSCGVRKNSLEVNRIYYLHEFKDGKKQGVWLVKYLKSHGEERIFEKKTYDGHVRLIWNHDNESMCSASEFEKDKFYVSIISDK